uniref:Uncharacterized protein n=1 Tax=Ananas comosus var. bracteatus TaxID=296719 RepID=A0A6V7NEB0_ANACO|nr:unnamed protein product [Ananas comosus var. bracteatus]
MAAVTVVSVAEPLVRRRSRRRCQRRGGGRGCGVRRRRLERSNPDWRPADAVDASGVGLLHSAIAQGRPDLVQLLLEFGADVEPPGRGPTTPLEASAAAGEALIAGCSWRGARSRDAGPGRRRGRCTQRRQAGTRARCGCFFFFSIV